MSGTGGMFAAVFAACFLALPNLAYAGPPAQVCERCGKRVCALPGKHPHVEELEISSERTAAPSLICHAGLCVPASVDDPQSFCKSKQLAAQGQPVASSSLDSSAVRHQPFRLHTTPQQDMLTERRYISFFPKGAPGEDAEGHKKFARVRKAPRYLSV